MKVTTLDPATVTNREVAALHTCLVAVEHELHPDEPMRPLALLQHQVRNPGTNRPRKVIVAWDDAGDAVGYADTSWADGAYSDRIFVDLGVRPDARRRGIGRALVEAVSKHVADAGRKSMIGSSLSDGPGVAFAQAVGARFGIEDFRSRLFLEHTSDSDVGVVDGMSIVHWVDRCPDEYVESFARLRAVMNSAPRGGAIEWPDDSFDVARIRRMEADCRLQHMHAHLVCARDDATGELVGLTELFVADEWPEVGDQSDTGVLPDYRRRGIARWIKAAMLQWLRAEWPDLRLITTWNATVNDSMLAVNAALGFGDRERWIEAEVVV